MSFIALVFAWDDKTVACKGGGDSLGDCDPHPSPPLILFPCLPLPRSLFISVGHSTSCPRLCFKARQIAKPLIRKCYSHANKTHFHKKGFALSLVLKVRVFGTRYWFIQNVVSEGTQQFRPNCILVPMPLGLIWNELVTTCPKQARGSGDENHWLLPFFSEGVECTTQYTCCTFHVSLCYYCCSYWVLICVTWTNTVRMFYTRLYPLKILLAVANWLSSQNGRSSATAIYFCFQAIPRYQLDIFYYM